MRTVVLSDIHLAAGYDSDLLRRRRFRDVLFDELEGADELVLLGDVVELRDRPLRQALDLARPFFEHLAEAIRSARVVIVPGNHDHQLIAPWLESRRMRGERPLGLQQLAPPETEIAAEIARLMPKADMSLAYPGLWVRPGVYATHGHYLDCHVTVPTFERLAIAVIEKLAGALPVGLRSTDDYESVQAPLYGLLYGIAQGGPRPRRGLGENASARVWEAVHGRDGRRPGVRGRLLGSVVLPGVVAAANRLGLGPLRWDISMAEIRQAGLRAMRELVGRLRLEADHVIFGHSHRRGPLGSEPGWELANGTRLLNTGSWAYAPGLMGPTAAGSVFWPGTVAVLEDERPPELRHLLDEMSHDELRGRRSRRASATRPKR
ncbi:MAG TPA: metallophosphoesterase [Solirubrobacterales bacterium]|nr:metallophosphoesterase [Solirubrobacterales bacterium]